MRGVTPPERAQASPTSTRTDVTSVNAFRARLLDALRASITERGYSETTISDIVARARASRRTFYAVWPTKDDCLLSLMDEVDTALAKRLTNEVDPGAPWQDQVAQAVQAYFEHVHEQPAVYLCAFRDLPALGDAARASIRKANDTFVGVIHDLSDNEEFRRSGLGPTSRRLALIVLGGLNEMIADVLESGEDIRDSVPLGIATTTALLSTSAGRSSVGA